MTYEPSSACAQCSAFLALRHPLNFILTLRHALGRPFDLGEGEGDERAPFLPNSAPRVRSQMVARIQSAVAFMLRHGCGRQVFAQAQSLELDLLKAGGAWRADGELAWQLLLLAIIFLTFWLVIFVFVLPVMDAKDRAVSRGVTRFNALKVLSM